MITEESAWVAFHLARKEFMLLGQEDQNGARFRPSA